MEKPAAVTSWFGWIPIALGVFWKGAEIAHNFEYVKKIVLERVDYAAIVVFLLHVPALALVLFGCAWVVWFEVRARRAKRAKAKELPPVQPQVLPPADEKPIAEVYEIPKDAKEVIVREKITKIEREIVVRRVG